MSSKPSCTPPLPELLKSFWCGSASRGAGCSQTTVRYEQGYFNGVVTGIVTCCLLFIVVLCYRLVCVKERWVRLHQMRMGHSSAAGEEPADKNWHLACTRDDVGDHKHKARED
ncbi:major facilitator superfamily transporter [Apiospora kogelbergensis]|uniref:Major facilitator superfamily transporter n=1 Tax=Apiospora kogelbergensis TaxID=1337665 RepID=A0AAW0QQS5_9PEZI